MDPHLRDGLLATAAGAVCLGALVGLDATAALVRFPVAGLGIAGALAVEAAFVAGTPAAALWESRPVRAVAATGLVVGGLGLGLALGPWVLAAVCWGLGTFFVLLALTLTGLWGEDPRADR